MSVKLDLGCGPYRRKGYIGLDIGHKRDLDIIGDAHNLPIRDNVMCEVISTKVFEHINNPYQCFFEGVRIMKEDSIFIIGVPNIHTFRRFLRWAVKGKISVGDHIYCWGLPELINLGKCHNLIYVCHYFDSYTRYGWNINFIEEGIRRFNKRIVDRNLNVVFWKE